MSHRDRLSLSSRQEGFAVEEDSVSGVIRAVGVPCLLKGGISSTCTIEKSYDPSTGQPREEKEVGGATHIVKIIPGLPTDGQVYYANSSPLGNHVGGDGRTYSFISIALNSGVEESARDLVSRYVRHIVGAEREAQRSQEGVPYVPSGPFKIPYTFEARAGMGQSHERIRSQRVLIVGLGGTGSYLLDLMVKTPVKEIHAFDGDSMDWHNYIRAPGSPTEEEIELQHSGDSPTKADYYRPKYFPLREGLELRALHIDSGETLDGYLAEHPIDFAFVCVDQLRDSDSPRQDWIYQSLSGSSIPFIDSGVSLAIEDDAVRGSITTSYYEAGSTEWERTIPSPKMQGNLPGYCNVQLPEVNSMAASLTVMEWRRQTGQYLSESTPLAHKFKIERPRIVFGD